MIRLQRFREVSNVKQLLTTVAVVAMLLVSATPAAAVALQTGSGLDAVPSTQVGTATPGGNIGPGDLSASTSARVPTDPTTWDVQAGKHASDLEVTIASETDGSFALVFTDDTNHDGRKVAVSRDALETSLGFAPGIAHGLHDSGDRWESTIEYRNGYAIFTVPKFSSSTVTFDGEVRLNGNPATDGSSFQYDLADRDAVNNFTINVTGTTSTEWDNETAASVGTSSSNSISPAGNIQPTGPGANGEPVLSVTSEGGESGSGWSSGTGDLTLAGDNSADGLRKTELGFDDPPAKFNELTYKIAADNTDDSITVDIYVVEEAPDGVYKEGTKIVSGHTISASAGTGNYTIPTSEYETTASTVTLEVVTTSASADGQADSFTVDVNDGPTSYYYVGGTSYDQYGAAWLKGQPATNLDATTDASATTYSFGDFSGGETKSKEIDLSTDATSLDFSGSGIGIDYQLEMKERTQTVDPAIDVNANTTSYTGSISDGQTVSLTTNETWVQQGTNNVNVSVTPGISADAPTPKADLDYYHQAVDTQSVSYVGETWSERYDVNKTWSSDRNEASVTFPFSSSVIAMRAVTAYENGTQVNPAYTDFNGTHLTVGLGDVTKNTESRVVANGSKVEAVNGAIEVERPTTAGNSLNTTVKITSYSTGFHIDVSNTSEKRWLHYTSGESWTNPNTYGIVQSGDRQQVYMPNASAGATTQVKTIPVEVRPQNDAWIRVTDPDSHEFRMKPGEVEGDSVTVLYYNTTSGEEYGLFSATRDGYKIDTDTAESPAILKTDDSDEVLYISLIEAASGVVSGSLSGGGGIAPPSISTSTGPLASPYMILLVGGVVVLGATSISSRLRSVPSWAAAAVVGLVAIVVIMSLQPGAVGVVLKSFGLNLAGGLGKVSSALWLAGGLIGLWAAYRFVKKLTRRKDVNLRIGGK